jgi:hypothetical protein
MTHRCPALPLYPFPTIPDLKRKLATSYPTSFPVIPYSDLTDTCSIWSNYCIHHPNFLFLPFLLVSVPVLLRPVLDCRNVIMSSSTSSLETTVSSTLYPVLPILPLLSLHRFLSPSSSSNNPMYDLSSMGRQSLSRFYTILLPFTSSCLYHLLMSARSLRKTPPLTHK